MYIHTLEYICANILQYAHQSTPPGLRRDGRQLLRSGRGIQSSQSGFLVAIPGSVQRVVFIVSVILPLVTAQLALSKL